MIIGTFLSTIQDWASGFGGVGLFVIALLDSSFLSFPQVNDILIIVLSTKYPARMPYYAGMTTIGSLVGCFLLYGVARRGGEAFMRKRLKGRYVDRALKLYQKYGLLAVVVPALLPPPVPFKVFVLMAGAAAVSPFRFGLAVVIGRGIRYFGQGYLAVLYGERAADFMKEYGAQVGVGLAVLAVVVGGIVIWMRRPQKAQKAQTDSDGRPTR
jgi:membrane protein YqaA with SNARE-associated domain